MNKKLLSIVVVNFLIFSFQLNAVKDAQEEKLSREIEIPVKRFVVDEELTHSPFSSGTPPRNPFLFGDLWKIEDVEFSDEELNSSITHELYCFFSEDLKMFLKINKLLNDSIESEKWLENFKRTEGFYNEEIARFDFYPSKEAIFIAAYIICNYKNKNSSYLDESFFEEIESWFWRLRAVLDGVKINIKVSQNKVISFIKKIEEAIEIAREESLDNVKKYLTDKLRYYKKIIEGKIPWDQENQNYNQPLISSSECYDGFYLEPLKEYGKRGRKKRAFNKRNSFLFSE